MMQGILIVDKPTDWTSFDVIAKLRGILGTRKLGHSGTLDPMATGVLPVFCGGASKAVDLQLDHTKAYRAVLRLGQRTDTGDVTGTVLETAPVTAGEQELYLGRDDADLIRGKRILLMDDVISTGGSLHAMEALVKMAGGTVTGRVAVLAEGDAQKRDDIRFLAPLPVFNADGTAKD